MSFTKTILNQSLSIDIVVLSFKTIFIGGVFCDGWNPSYNLSLVLTEGRIL